MCLDTKQLLPSQTQSLEFQQPDAGESAKRDKGPQSTAPSDRETKIETAICTPTPAERGCVKATLNDTEKPMQITRIKHNAMRARPSPARHTVGAQ